MMSPVKIFRYVSPLFLKLGKGAATFQKHKEGAWTGSNADERHGDPAHGQTTLYKGLLLKTYSKTSEGSLALLVTTC